MTNTTLYALCGVALFAIGFHGVITCRHLLKRIIALNLMGTSVFLALIAFGHQTGSGRSDPVPHAMVLTGIVVSVSATALALVLIRRLFRETGLVELIDNKEGS